MLFSKIKSGFFIFFSVIIMLAYYSCSRNVETIDTATIKNSSKPNSFNVFEINKPGIVILWSDSAQMQQMKAKDSDAFYVSADDYSFYSAQLMTLADSLSIA